MAGGGHPGPGIMEGGTAPCDCDAKGACGACAEPEPEMPAAGDLDDREDADSPLKLDLLAARGPRGLGQRQVSNETSESQLSQLSQQSATSASSAGVPDVTSVHAWSPDDVAQWMRSVGLGHCAEALRQHYVGGGTLLGLASGASPSASLAALGISALGDRKRILKAIRQLEIDTVHVTKGTGGPWALHFMFMSASPLVRMDAGGAAEPLKALDVEAEQHAICQATADAGYACRFQHVCATVRTLSWAVVHQSCCVLIFSGHTLPSGQWLLETETGEALPFEPLEILQQEGGGAARAPEGGAAAAAAAGSAEARGPAGPQQVGGATGSGAAAPQPGPEPTAQPAAAGPGPRGQAFAPPPRVGAAARFRLVVLHAPHPDATATRFLDAGVPHVIVIERPTSDDAPDAGASVFLQNLCHSLVQGGSVQQAFRHAERLARHSESCMASPPSSARCSASAVAVAAASAVAPQGGGARRIALLPRGSEHHEVLMPSLSRGPPMRCSPARAVGQFPRTGLDLSGCRRLEMWRVLRALRFRRLVQVLGPPGSGKRTLVCLVANYTWQRNLFPDGVHYVHIQDLVHATASAGGAGAGEAAAAGEAAEAGAGEAAEEAGAEEAAGSALFEHTPALPGHKLLVLDGCEELYRRACRQTFVAWLSRLLTENPELQLLITARSYLPVSSDHSRDPLLGNLEDHTVEVRELSEGDALRQLRWTCRSEPQLWPLVREHGAEVAALCGRLPFALDLFARWAAAQPCLLGGGGGPRAALAALEEAAARAAPGPAAALELALAALPGELREALRLLAELPGAFCARQAAERWGAGRAEAEARLASLRERRLLEAADSGAMAARLAAPAEAEAPVPRLSCYRLHPLLQEHLRGAGGGTKGATRAGEAR